MNSRPVRRSILRLIRSRVTVCSSSFCSSADTFFATSASWSSDATGADTGGSCGSSSTLMRLFLVLPVRLTVGGGRLQQVHASPRETISVHRLSMTSAV
eukprot:1612288-Prymnesium_polylepis.1